MSILSVQGEQSTSSEIITLMNLTALATASAGQFLYKTGTTTFAHSTLSEILTLTNLSDVTISSLASGQTLTYNGSSWVNSSETGTGTVTSVSVVTANGVSGTVATSTTTPAITLTLGAITPSAIQISGLTASEIVATDASKNLVSLAVATYPSLTELTYVKGLTSSAQTQITAKAPSTAPTFATSITGSYLTASEILITDASKNIVSAAVATYPSLTELSYVKGVTSAIQTQLGLKAPLASPTFTGTVTIPTPFTLGAVSVTTTGTILNYLTSAGGTTGTTSTNIVFSTSPVFITPTLGVASATSLATSAATPLLLTNGQLVNIALTSQTVGATTLTIPDFASVVDEFVFKTKAVTMSNKTFIAPALGTPASGVMTNVTGVPAAAILAGSFGAGAYVISTSLQTATIELGHATDTTLARVSAGVISVEGITIPTISSTDTITNKRIEPRIVSAASYTTDTGTSLSVATADIFVITAQAGALLFNNPGGTPVQGQKLVIRIKDNATARALTWGTEFRAMGTALPSTTVLSKTLYLGFFYNSTDVKWDLVASAQEA